jgi:hypothetical protein
MMPIDVYSLTSVFLSLPWKITMKSIGKPSISMGHGFHGEL